MQKKETYQASTKQDKTKGSKDDLLAEGREESYSRYTGAKKARGGSREIWFSVANRNSLVASLRCSGGLHNEIADALI